MENHVYYNCKIIAEAHGGMAGIPISPFFANIYMADIDTYFHENNIEYYRYSDDIILFVDTYEELMSLKTILYSKINDLKLEIKDALEERKYIKLIELTARLEEVAKSQNADNYEEARIISAKARQLQRLRSYEK